MRNLRTVRTLMAWTLVACCASVAFSGDYRARDARHEPGAFGRSVSSADATDTRRFAGERWLETAQRQALLLLVLSERIRGASPDLRPDLILSPVIIDDGDPIGSHAAGNNGSKDGEDDHRGAGSRLNGSDLQEQSSGPSE